MNVMRKLAPIVALVSFVLAAVVFVFAEGARSVYSGLFFVMIGAVALASARRNRRSAAR